MTRLIDYFKLYFKGMAMGGADVVPGVSGGTIAFITGIYEKLLESINKIDRNALFLLKQGKFLAFWHQVNGAFLFTLVAGILTSIFSLAKLLSFLIDNYPIHIWSFFFGLIIIAAFSVIKDINRWTIGVALAGLLGVLVGFLITMATPAETPTGLWFIFLSGAIAICAMILPGISGGFLLLVLGKYEYIITSVENLDIPVLIIFAFGCGVGLLSFSRLIYWFLKKYYNAAIALLAGFMVGSLNKIWPWKLVTSFQLDSHGMQKPMGEKNVWPMEYFRESGNEPHLLEALLFMALGIIVVVLLEKFAGNRSKTRAY